MNVYTCKVNPKPREFAWACYGDFFSSAVLAKIPSMPWDWAFVAGILVFVLITLPEAHKKNIYTQTKYLAVFVKPQIKSKLVFVFNRSVHSYRWDCRVSSCPKNGANPDCRKNHAVSGAMPASGGACLPCVGFHHQTKLLFLSLIALLPPRQDVPCQGDRKAQGTPEVLLM